MVAFFVYDLVFLGLFILFVILFLYKNRRNLQTEKFLGLPVFLYRAKWGMKAIEKVGQKSAKVLHIVKYFSIALGFVLMAGILYVIGKSVYIYAAFPQITQIIKAPPVAPLIPYFPQIFGVESFFPPFYFTYFIIALAIVAIVHEFSHGIFMRLYKIRIKSTGFAFFGPFLGAFVEEEKKQFVKKSNIGQMSVLSAGVFANIVFALIFFLLLAGFFYVSFEPAGYIFNSYSYSVIPAAAISIGNQTGDFSEIFYQNKSYFLDERLRTQLDRNLSMIAAYDDAPAFRAGLKGAITEINGAKITSSESLREFISMTSPGDEIIVKTIESGEIKSYNIILGENPSNSSRGYLGVANLPLQREGIISAFLNLFSFKNPSIYYAPSYDGDFVIFIYDLLWWVMIINFLVALFNMLPLGILDGGRFFYLAVLSVTKSEKFSAAAFRFVSMLIGFAFLLLIFFWLIAL
jgi:membrane-associated protease RseP (regulator of RpoE activity)